MKLETMIKVDGDCTRCIVPGGARKATVSLAAVLREEDSDPLPDPVDL